MEAGDVLRQRRAGPDIGGRLAFGIGEIAGLEGVKELEGKAKARKLAGLKCPASRFLLPAYDDDMHAVSGMLGVPVRSGYGRSRPARDMSAQCRIGAAQDAPRH